MKTQLNTYLMIFVLIFCVSGIMPVSASSQTINWEKYNEGMAMAKAQGKKLFINFYANWCTFCKAMDNKTFKDSKVVDYLNKNFIPINVDVDKQKKIASFYGIRSLPTILFIAEDGKQYLTHLQGYIHPKMMFKYLEYVQAGKFSKK